MVKSIGFSKPISSGVLTRDSRVLPALARVAHSYRRLVDTNWQHLRPGQTRPAFAVPDAWKSAVQMKRVLILCTGNSCRSQMAEALWNKLGGGWQALSAGSHPSGHVHALAILAMNEIGIDISGQRSEHVNTYADQTFDLVVTVCNNVRESCPVLPGAQRIVHWPFDDPAEAVGTNEQRLDAFRVTRDLIAAHIARYIGEANTLGR